MSSQDSVPTATPGSETVPSGASGACRPLRQHRSLLFLGLLLLSSTLSCKRSPRTARDQRSREEALLGLTE